MTEETIPAKPKDVESAPPPEGTTPAQTDEVESESLPSRAFLDDQLIENLLQPPDLSVARQLPREINTRLKRKVPTALIADALRRLAKPQRSSRAKDRTFVRSALIDRLRREADWVHQPIVGALPAKQDVGADGDALPNGNWSWRPSGLTIHSTDEGRYGVLHLFLSNSLPDLNVGQPYDIVLADASNTFGWSAVASAQPPGTCPDGCQGSLTSIAVAAESEILGHLSFSLPPEIGPSHWGLLDLDEDSIELRALPTQPTGRQSRSPASRAAEEK